MRLSHHSFRKPDSARGQDPDFVPNPGNPEKVTPATRLCAPAAIVSLDLARENKSTKSNSVVTFSTSETEQNRDEVTSELLLAVRTPV